VVGVRPGGQLRPVGGAAHPRCGGRRPAHGAGQGHPDHAVHHRQLAAVQPSYGIALYRSGRQIFAGPVTSRTLTWDSETNAATIKVEAVGDEVVLADRLALPDPLRAADDQTVNDYWTSTGKASTAMRQLISDQAGATCAASRKVTGLTLGVDPNVGVSTHLAGPVRQRADLLTTMSAPRARTWACASPRPPARWWPPSWPAQPVGHGGVLGRPVQRRLDDVHRERADRGQRPGGRPGRPAPADPQDGGQRRPRHHPVGAARRGSTRTAGTPTTPPR
jgi:hypothetical protein